MPLPLAAGTPSAWELILNADPIVKAVLLVLLSFSLVSWAIILQRIVLLRKAWQQSVVFLDRFWSTTSLEQANQEVGRYPDSPVALAFASGYRELVKVNEVAAGAPSSTFGATENVSRSLRKAASEQMTRLERTIPFLASCGSSAPFIGLFGTVWGILRAFQQIGAQGTTSIAEVGPFIAEALVATAVGLFAAIPAVLFYNYFATQLKILAREVNHFSADFLNLVERHERSKGR